MWHLCGKQSVYTWRNKLVPLEAWVGREGRRKETGWRSRTSERKWSREMVEDKRNRRKEVCSGPEHHITSRANRSALAKLHSPESRTPALSQNQLGKPWSLSLSFPICPRGRIISPPQEILVGA